MGSPTWTTERDDEVRKYSALGWSSLLIGAAMGVTRCSIIGRARRAGISLALSPLKTAPKSIPKRIPKRKTEPATLWPADPFVDELAMEEPDECPTDAIDIMVLTNTTCRWPYGDGPYWFCGACEADEIGGRPYCAKHTRIAGDGFRGRKRCIPGIRLGKFEGASAIFERVVK